MNPIGGQYRQLASAKQKSAQPGLAGVMMLRVVKKLMIFADVLVAIATSATVVR